MSTNDSKEGFSVQANERNELPPIHTIDQLPVFRMRGHEVVHEDNGGWNL